MFVLKTESFPSLPGYIRVPLVVLALYAAGLNAIAWIANSKVVFNETRAAPTLALFHGIQIYTVGLKDVSFCVLYGPLSYLFYLPAALFTGPHSFFLAGSMIAFLLYCIPLFLFLWHLRESPVNRFWIGLLLAIVFALVTVNSSSLTMSAMQVSPDAVALGFSGAACTLLFFHSGKRPWLDPLLMAAFTCFAVFSKQNMVALVILLPLFALLTGGRSLTLRLIACLAAGAVLTVAILFALYHDLGAVYFNVVVVVKQQPLYWRRAPRAARFIYEQAAFLIFVVGCLALVAAAAVGRLRARQWARGLLFPCMTVAFVPASIGGMVFWGGWLNALSPCLYFALLTLLALSYVLLVEVPAERGVRPMALGILVVFACILSPSAAEKADRSSLREVSGSDMVYRYELEHPGQAYFPFHQVSVYLAGHRFYHSSWGVMDLMAGRFPFTRQEVWAHVPPNARYLAYPPGLRVTVLEPYLAPSFHEVKLPGLSGFVVYEIER